MKSKQILSIEQILHLQELGLDTNNASAEYYRMSKKMDWFLVFGCRSKEELLDTEENIPAYTLQDVLDALPLQVEIPLHPESGKYELRIKRMVFDEGRVMYSVVYEKEDYIDWIVLYSDEVLIDAAYEMLC